jgi:hypothetical protein
METWEQLGQAINKISSEDEVRCVILRGPDRSAFAALIDDQIQSRFSAQPYSCHGFLPC